MTSPRSTVATAPASARSVWRSAALLVAAVVLAYANSFSGPFVFDDGTSIAENPSIRHLWPPSSVLSPPATAGTGGRPLANLTLALNYALGGDAVWGYHAGNLLIHTLAALALFGLVRRTLLLPSLQARFGPRATWLALAIAGLWALHPVQSITVNYISQRTESLMGLAYFLTLYCFARSVTTDARAPRLWFTLSVTACALGMASKEVMVTAPLLALLYDRTFVAGSFAAAWRQRWKFYVALAATWLLLAYLMMGLETRGVGFATKIKWWDYTLGGGYAIFTYLRLSLWPSPLVFDYGPKVIDQVTTWPYFIAVLALATLTLYALWRRPRYGVLGAWFLLILAPTSGIVPIVRQMVAENRVYVPLAAIITLVVLTAFHFLQRRAFAILTTLALLLGLATHARNDTYRSAVSLWTDTAQKRPANWRAHNSLASALTDTGQYDAAIQHYRTSLQLDPTLAETHYNLGTLLDRANRPTEAVAVYEAALKIEPWRADAHTNLANALIRTGRPQEAVPHLEEALRLNASLAVAHNSLANLLFQSGRTGDAIAHYEKALQLSPDSADAHGNLGFVLSQLGRHDEAITHLQRSLQLRSDSANTHYILGNALAFSRRLDEAATHYQAALRLDPAAAEAANNLGIILLQANRRTEARAQFEAAVRTKPDYLDARLNLASLQLAEGQLGEARSHYEAVLRLDPSSSQAREALAKIALATVKN